MQQKNDKCVYDINISVCVYIVCVCREFAYVCVVRVHQRFKISEWKCIKTKVKRENTHTHIHT